MRRAGASPLATGGRSPFPLSSLYVFSFFSAFVPCSPHILPRKSPCRIWGGGEITPRRSRGCPFGGSGTSTKKHHWGPTTDTYSGPRTHTLTHTHTLLRRLITAGNSSLHTDPMRGQKHNIINYHHRTFTHEHDVSRRNPPRGGEEKNSSITISIKTALPRRPRILLSMTSIPEPSSSSLSPPQPADTSYFLRDTRRSVSLYTRHLHIYPDFSRQRKELSRSRENRKDSQPRLKDIQPIFPSPYVSVFSPLVLFIYSTVLPARFGGGGGMIGEGSTAFYFPIASLNFDPFIFNFFSFLSLISS